MLIVVEYLREYLRDNRRPRLHLALAVLLATAFAYNYLTGFKQTILDSFWGSWLYFPVYLLFFAVPYLGTLLLTVAGTEEAQRLRSGRFWLVCSAMLLALALNRWALRLPPVLTEMASVDRSAVYFWQRCLVSLLRALTLVGAAAVFRLLWERERSDLYGLRWQNFHWRPYLLLLAVMVPPITWASFQPAFLHTYPIYRPGLLEQARGLPIGLTYGFHELCYALQFVGVEVFFRGFLVLGMVRYLGRATLLPMVVLYAFWHFGKPFPEALGSVFGAYILGIIALRSGSINGGIIIHMGVALLMNLAAFIQLQFR